TKQIELQRLQLELKLNLVLSEQLAYLEDWALLERGHFTSLAGVVKDLEASTLRVPVTGGAKTDTESLKAAISSALDVMQAMGSSVSSVLPKVEDTHYLVSELAERASYEKIMLDESESLLASLAVLQESLGIQ
ncbi:AUGMIN subunit 8-like protein, partial [Drosera capensis]